MLYKIKKNADMKQTKKDYALQNQQKCIHKIFKKTLCFTRSTKIYTKNTSKIIEQHQRNELAYTTRKENEAVLFCQPHQQLFTHSF